MQRNSSIFKIGLGLIALLLFQLPVCGQLTSGNLAGTVYDPAGATVPGATVTAHNDATGVDTSTTSTSAGAYRFDNLPIGTYTLNVTATGFKNAQVRNITIALNQTVTNNVQLTIGQAATTVEVSEAFVQIDTTTAQGVLVFHMFSALAEFERTLIRERTRAGLAAVKRAGRTGGRPPKLTEDDLDVARTLLANPDIRVADVADRLGVSPATLYRYLPAAKAANSPST